MLAPVLLPWPRTLPSFFKVLNRHCPAVGEVQNPVVKATRDAVNVFSHLSRFAKISVRRMHKYGFSQKFQMQRCVFVVLIRFLAVSWIQ